MIDTFSIRCSILHLAFSGKLAQTCNEDGSARNLLSRISGKKDVEQTENPPYEIPESWAWAKLGDLYRFNPKVEANDATEAAFVPMERISAGFEQAFSFERQSWVQASKNHSKFADGDVAVAKISPCFENRKAFIAQGLPNGIGGGTTELIVLRQREILPAYTYYLLLDQRFIDTGKASYKGTVGQQRVQTDVIKNFLVPIPPYLEQRRIVDKIDQAFSILDTIDALQAQYADNLTVLKTKLLEAAIQGKLTEQLPEDGTAEDLYRQIQTQKQALIKAGKIKKEKPLPKITADEIPFEIPANWKWVRLASISSIINGDRGKNYPAKSTLKHEGIPFISALNLNGVSVTQDEHLLCLDNRQYELLGNGKLQKDDIVICIRGSLGKHGRYPFDKGAIASSLVICRLFYSKEIIGDYIMTWLDSSAFPAEIKRYDSGTAQPNLAANSLEQFLIPLPPLAEQKRIVAKLDEVLEMIGQTPPRALREKN